MGEHEVAVQSYERAISLRPGESHPLQRLGIYLQRLGRGEAGLVLLKRAVEVDPDNWEVYLTIGGFLQIAKRFVRVNCGHWLFGGCVF